MLALGEMHSTRYATVIFASHQGAHVPLLMAAHRADSFSDMSSRFWALASGVHQCSGQKAGALDLECWLLVHYDHWRCSGGLWAHPPTPPSTCFRRS